MIGKLAVVLVFTLIMLGVGLLRARSIGVPWRETAWPGFTLAAIVYLIGGLLAIGR